MRRAQVDEWSQPVRNQCTTPNFEAQGALANIRQNLATDPRATSLTVVTGSAGWRNTRWFGLAPAAGAYSLVTGAADGPIPEITSYARKTWTVSATGSPGDSGFENITGASTNPGAGMPVTAGTTYTFSSYLRSSAAGKTGALIQVYWKDAATNWISTSQSGYVALTAGAWTRLSLTATAPAGAVTVGMVSDVDTGSSWLAGDTLDGTGLMIEASPVLGSYLDGTFAASGDFIYAWSGTANNSTSVMRANLVSTVTGVNLNAVSSTQWMSSGTRSCRLVPSNSTGSTDSYAAPGGDTAAMRLGMEAGKTYTIAANFRQDAVLTGTLRSATPVNLTIFWKPAGGGYTYRTSSSKANAIGIERLSVTFTLPVDCVEAFVRFYHGGQRGAGDIWVDDFIITEGVYPGDYIDGTKPFSKWDGTANASTSVGYPPQLFDFAGKPALDLYSAGASVNSGGVAIPVGAFDARTVYLCYESYNNTQNYPNFGYYGVQSSKGVTFQTGPSGGSTLFPRFDFPGGSSNIGVTLTNGRRVMRHVIAMSFPTGLASVTSMIDGNADRTDALTPGTGWDDGRASLQGTFTDGRGIRMLVFYAEHDRATRVAISRYLGNKYGALVA